MCNGRVFRYTSSIIFRMTSLPTDSLGDEASLARRISEAAPDIACDAESRLYRLLAPRVRLYGLRHLRDEQAAADLMQQVLLLTIEKLRAGELREPERVGSFVFGVCRMVVLELRRGQARRGRLLQQYGEDLAIADISVAPRLDHDRLSRCLERLSERERSVLVMTFYGDNKAEEVAKGLNLTAGNVRVIRHRALKHLRDCMTGEEL
jgi:RNA polymerase sigma-70 factor, ECF subfamily